MLTFVRATIPLQRSVLIPQQQGRSLESSTEAHFTPCRYSTVEIEREVQEMREQMQAENASLTEKQKLDDLKARDDTHALAKRKEIEMGRFKAAFGVRDDKVLACLRMGLSLSRTPVTHAGPVLQTPRAVQPEAKVTPALEGLPEQLRIEDNKSRPMDRFEAEEKELEAKLLAEEEEELAKERYVQAMQAAVLCVHGLTPLIAVRRRGFRTDSQCSDTTACTGTTKCTVPHGRPVHMERAAICHTFIIACTDKASGNCSSL
jgi:hypothetical protein